MKPATFVISRNIDIDCILINNFSFFLTFFESLRVALINTLVILMMSTKLIILDLLKVKVFWNKAFDVIFSVHEVTNKSLSRDSNCTVDVVMQPKFGN